MAALMAHPQTLLITGAAGLIGFNAAEYWMRTGVTVIGVDRLEHFKSRTEHRRLPIPTLVDRGELFTWLDSGHAPEIDAIVHLGACTDTTELNEAYLTEINLEYSKRIWDVCVQKRIPLVYASSAATYGGGEHGYSDDEAGFSKLQPLNPYGVSKQQFDLWALDQESRGHTPPSWSGFKFFNVYGFGERHKTKMASVVLHAFDQIRNKGQVRLFKSHRAGIADGEQQRDFIWVQDVIRVLAFALHSPIPRGIYNLGTGEARSFLDLARAVFAALDQPEQIEFVDTPVGLRERYQYFTQAEMKKLRAAGYTHPFTRLEDGVEAYVQELVQEARLAL